MAYGYVIAQVSVTDPDTYPDYIAQVSPLVGKYGGEYMARGGRAEAVEGPAPGERTVIIRFPSYDRAMEWYHSDEYTEIRKIRMSASTGILTIVEGVT